MYLTSFDEYFSHQVSLPHAIVGSSDPSWRERYWISLQDVSSDMVLSMGMGQYPNQDVQEAFVVLSYAGQQHNVRMSRELGKRNDLMEVGPFSIEIVEPFRSLRLRLADNPSGISFDITWHGTMQPILEGRHFQVNRARATYDAIRYLQLGRASGSITHHEKKFELTADNWWGERDHSWGTRPIPRVDGAPPEDRPEWRMMMFFPFQMRDFSIHMYVMESAPGRPVHVSAGIGAPYDASAPSPLDTEGISAVDHDLEWEAGALSPTLTGGTVTLTLTDGEELAFELTAKSGRAYLRGGGYGGWNGWYQGHWKGDGLEHETWDLSDRSQYYRYAKLSSDHLIEVRHNGEVGYGIMEYMVLPGYGRYDDALPPPRTVES